MYKRQALDYALTENYDGIILDIMMPKKSGLEVLAELRRSNINTPILMLTAKSEVNDRVTGLDTGADDYPVSYTHLDVYKRQQHSCLNLWGKKERCYG